MEKTFLRYMWLVAVIPVFTVAILLLMEKTFLQVIKTVHNVLNINRRNPSFNGKDISTRFYLIMKKIKVLNVAILLLMEKTFLPTGIYVADYDKAGSQSFF